MFFVSIIDVPVDIESDRVTIHAEQGPVTYIYEEDTGLFCVGSLT